MKQAYAGLFQTSEVICMQAALEVRLSTAALFKLGEMLRAQRAVFPRHRRHALED